MKTYASGWLRPDEIQRNARPVIGIVVIEIDVSRRINLCEQNFTDAVGFHLFGVDRNLRDGRRVGSTLNVRDVSSEYAQANKHFTVQRLDRYDAENDEWREILIEDRRSGPAETAAARLDIGRWFATLPRKKRRIATTLAITSSRRCESTMPVRSRQL